VPWPKEESRLLAPIRPFQPAVSNSMCQNLSRLKAVVHNLYVYLRRCGYALAFFFRFWLQYCLFSLASIGNT